MEIFLLALVIDLLISDNLGRFHPVVLIGKLISLLEEKLYKIPDTRYQIPERKKQKKLAGLVLVGVVASTSFSLTIGLLKVFAFNQWLLFIFSAFVISTTFAFRGLLSSGLAIYKALKSNNLPSARSLLSKIVGRDTQNLNEEQIIKATIESLAENTVDGVIAPIFYALLGGVAIAMLYRSINTLDSMVGYRNKRYEQFGWAAAKLDDIANFIPARIGMVLIWLASLLCRLDFRETVKTSLKDGPKHASPNSGLSEAAFAGALGIQLGGIAYYQGLPKEMPILGLSNQSINLVHIKQSIQLISVTTIIWYLVSGIWYLKV